MRRCFALGVALATSVEGFLPAVSEMREKRRGGNEEYRNLQHAYAAAAAGSCHGWVLDSHYVHYLGSVSLLSRSAKPARVISHRWPSHNLSRLPI